ncbi:MAG TPA: MFS transporter, partial [Acidimicrobiales bacterium]|nr:MFS transporter [Acidimicrobiales bacterium]
ASPGYWWFVAIFALGRPLLSATNALAGVCAAEETAFADRSKAVALVAAGYALGAGLLAFIHGLAGSIGFRGTVLLGVVPLAFLPFLGQVIEEPDRYARYSVAAEHRLAVVAAVGRQYRKRLLLISLVVMGTSVITGPANSFVFLYAENVAHMSGATTSLMVAAAGVTGFGGLLLGRYMADNIGRRLSIVIGLCVVVCFGVMTYSGRGAVVFVGYALGVLAAAVLAPSAGSYVNELFPTSVRASVAGFEIAAGVVGAVVGLLVFGSVADVGNRFGWAAAFTFVPALLFLLPLLFLPETKDTEPEDLWPESDHGGIA